MLMLKTQFHTQIQQVRSDNGGEFVNKFLLHLFLTSGMIHQTTCPNTPEQNGVVERKHRHLIETTLTLLLQANMPTQFWLEALTTAIYLVNRMPHSSLKFQIPYVLLFQSKPDPLFLKSFGCSCYPWLKPYNDHKLMPKSIHCVFLGYCPATKGYRCLDPISSKVYISRHVKFVENSFPYSSIVSTSSSVSAQSLSFPISLTDFSDLHVSVPISMNAPCSVSEPDSVVPLSVVPEVNSSSSCPVTESPSLTSPSSDSLHSPSHPPVSNVHHMQTRSKVGTFKPKHPFVFHTVSSNASSPTVEPYHFSEAVKFPAWQQAMAEGVCCLGCTGYLDTCSSST